MTGIIDKYVEVFARRRDLPELDAEPLLDAMISETDESLLAKLFLRWKDKGIAEDEIYSIAKIMKRRCTKITSRHETYADIVGTGGSRTKTFNVSTAATFVIAGDGLPVAKHGNRAATSNSGSADALSELGIVADVEPAVAERQLNELGVCFMFAPRFHRLSPTLGKVRRQLGFPTVFNCVGPLCNPASAPFQLVGVWDEDILSKMAGALSRLGTRKSWIVCGEGGLDEISMDGVTKVAEVDGREIRTFEIRADDLGLRADLTERIAKLNARESAELIRRVLLNDLAYTAAESLVAVNAAAVFLICGLASNLGEGVEFALESLRRGDALRKLNALAETVTA